MPSAGYFRLKNVPSLPLTGGTLTGALSVNGDLTVGTSTVGAPSAGRTYISVKGSLDGGVVEFQTPAADADGSPVGYIQFTDATSTAADKRVALIRGLKSGTTANNRGGRIEFFTKSDGFSGLTSRLVISRLGEILTGSGNTLEDGAGNMTVKGLTVSKAVNGAFAATFTNSGGNGNGVFIASGSAGTAGIYPLNVTDNTGGQSFFNVQSSGKVSTAVNVLDYGTGLAYFKGIHCADTRSVNSLPAEYLGAARTMEFKFTATIGLTGGSVPTYCLLETLKPWNDDSGGKTMQIAYITDTGAQFFRIGSTSSNTWGAWQPMGGSKVDITACVPFGAVQSAITLQQSFAPVISFTGKGFLNHFTFNSNTTAQARLRITVDGVVRFEDYLSAGSGTYYSLMPQESLFAESGQTKIFLSNPTSTTNLSSVVRYPYTAGAGKSSNTLCILPTAIYASSSLLVEMMSQAGTTGAQSVISYSGGNY